MQYRGIVFLHLDSFATQGCDLAAAVTVQERYVAAEDRKKGFAGGVVHRQTAEIIDTYHYKYTLNLKEISPAGISTIIARPFQLKDDTRLSLPKLIHPGTRNVEKELIEHLRSKRCIRRSRHSRGRRTVPRSESSMPSPSGKDLQRSKTALFPVLGRAICSEAPGTVTSQRWWNDIRVLPSWSKCPANTQRRSSPR